MVYNRNIIKSEKWKYVIKNTGGALSRDSKL